jgi:signal peptidase I
VSSKAETEEMAAAKSNKQMATTKDRVWREVLSWFWVILAFFFIEGTLVQARVIPSGSMENTVLIGDHLIVSRIGYSAGVPFTAMSVPLWREPKRQQIIVFRAPLPQEGYPDFIKRVVGVPGDHIKITDGRVVVNGVQLKEPYVRQQPGMAGIPMDNFPPSDNSYAAESQLTPTWATELPQYVKDGTLDVPPGKYFVMGDNRENSFDSRYWGFVPRANIIGVPVMIYMSINAPEEVWDPGHIGERFETYLSVFIHPSEVRWKRLFHTF